MEDLIQVIKRASFDRTTGGSLLNRLSRLSDDPRLKLHDAIRQAKDLHSDYGSALLKGTSPDQFGLAIAV
jgi:hypothetical protein